MTELTTTDRSRLKRKPERGLYDREAIYAILDEALVCHVGFVEDAQPYVIPINFARVGDTIVMHGAKASRLLKHVAAGHALCVEVTLVDGLVLARSVFNHSVNYRSVVLFGSGRLVEEDEEKLVALEAITEHLIPGRWQEARLPNDKELKATGVVAIKIDQGSAKVRSGPPVDDEADYALPVWAGVLPFKERALPPVPDERMAPDIDAPAYITNYSRKPNEALP
jgi:nitroimidazol reductase NimA-like FMN-containing flavoprotein (pyridoxamine 5'-phosphate oxidase superfamily)